MKRIQNVVAESRRTLPITVGYGVLVWLLAGLLKEHWWIQFACFAVSMWLMMELNNQNLLIRIYSRTVSSSYIVFTCIAVFLFPSVHSAILQLLAITSLFLLFKTYQDKTSAGKIFYTFMCIGLSSLVDVQVFYYLPVYWLIMGMTVYSLGWRTFFASLFGLITPYWFSLAWYVYKDAGDITPWIGHFSTLGSLQFPIAYSALTLQQLLLLGFLMAMFILGAIHFVMTSYKDKIRVRQIYYSFILMTIYSYVLIAFQPTLYNKVIHMIIITTSPMIAHFISLTNSRLTNILFFVLVGVALFLTAMNLWISSYPS